MLAYVTGSVEQILDDFGIKRLPCPARFGAETSEEATQDVETLRGYFQVQE
jgi:hypothetical protein